MIKEVELKNFQGHKHSKMELVPGINTIIGTSDHGKSSVIRSIRLVNENKPGGTDYISHWAWPDSKKYPKDACEVTITTTEGDTLKRVRGPNTDNKYVFNDSELNAFGVAVPEEITDSFNISELNFQKQEDSFFLINASSGEIMRKINKFVDLELIDKVLSTADSDIRATKSELRHQQATLDDTVAKLKPFEVVDQLEDMVDKATEINAILSLSQDKKKELLKFIEKLESKQSEIQKLSRIDRLDKLIQKALKDQDVINETRGVYRELQALASRHRNLEKSCPEIPKKTERLLSKAIELDKEIVKVEETLSGLESLIKKYNINSDIVFNLSKADIDINSLILSYENVQDNGKELSGLISLLKKHDNNAEAIRNMKREIREKEAEFKKIMPEECPLCGSSLKECSHARNSSD